MRARVVARRSLPGVRAGSGLAHFRGGLAIAQDDADAIALVTGERIEMLPLPWDSGGEKHRKLDLEAIVAIGDRLIAFGSGSTAVRKRIAQVGDRTTLHDATAFYDALPLSFTGSELNLEGVVLDGDDLLLVQRGNGAGDAIDATARVSLSDLLAFLEGGAVPVVRDVVRWELGAIGGCRLTFTDATRMDGAIVFSAAAENSANTYEDGDVCGVAIGVLAPSGARWTHVLDERGTPLLEKIEGIAPDGDRLLAVVDADDPKKACELLTLEIDL